MKRLNLLLAGLAVLLMIMAMTLLFWLRDHFVSQREASVANIVAMFQPRKILHGPAGDAMAHFDAIEQLAGFARENPFVRDIVVTRLLEGGQEATLSPFTFAAEHGGRWREELATWRPEPWGEAGQPQGMIYLDLDETALSRVNGAIGATALAIILSLATLLLRVWSQQGKLTRTTIELNERRRELIRVERLALAGQLAAGLLHDLRKPVMNIKHTLDDLETALGDFAGAAEGVQDLRRQTRLFFQMLSESQIERFVQSDKAGEEFVDLGPVLDFSLNLVRYERQGVEVIRRETRELPTVLAQPFRLIQLFSNLILNAYQAMNGQGRLVIQAERLPDGGVEIKISDTGSGIAPEALDKIFDPFFTTKPEGQGTGLGLSICRMIVEDLHGTLNVESPPGGPTTFSVRLPGEIKISK